MMENIHPIYNQLLTRGHQERLLNQKGLAYWFTGLSGSGKSTIASAFEKELYSKGYLVKVLDGDNIRSGINKNLGFSLEDRKENIRRVAEVAKLFVESGIIVLCSFVSPTEAMRKLAEEIIGDHDFKEVFVNTPLIECERRDVKGLYKKARAGEINGFTGIDSPFERPKNPSIELKTMESSIENSVNILLRNYEQAN